MYEYVQSSLHAGVNFFFSFITKVDKNYQMKRGSYGHNIGLLGNFDTAHSLRRVLT